MTKEQATQFVRDVLQQLWDKWQPSDFQINVWIALLCHYDYDESEAALRRWYAHADKVTMKPFPGQVRKILVGVGGAPQQNTEPCKVYGLARGDKPDTVTWFYTNGYSPNWQRVGDVAERGRKRFEELYGGSWVIIRPPEEVHDDGLRGEAALHNAEALIIAGPDTPGRRFLIRAKRLGESAVL